MSNYPTLRLGVLQSLATLKAACDSEEGYLRKRDCPYDNDTIDLLEQLFKPREIEIIKEVLVDKPSRGAVGRPAKDGKLTDDDVAEVEEEAKNLLLELRQLGQDSDGEMKALDTQTKLSIIKVRSSLMEKLVGIRERFSSVRKVAAFQTSVISILDDLVPDDARDEFMKRLEPYRN